MSTSLYPECEKLLKIKGKSNIIGEFLDYYLSRNNYVICQYFEQNDIDQSESGYYPIRKSIEQMLAEYFGIDLNKVEDERRRMLEEIRKNEQSQNGK